MLSGYRKETDAHGEREVPAGALYGIAALRGSELGAPCGSQVHPAMARAVAAVLLACARADVESGSLDEGKFHAVEMSCAEIISGGLGGHIIVDAALCDGGCAAVANIAEVAANRAILLLGGGAGDYGILSPCSDLLRGRDAGVLYHAAGVAAVAASMLSLKDSFGGLATCLYEASQDMNVKDRGRISAAAALFSNCRMGVSKTADDVLSAPILPLKEDGDARERERFRLRAAAHLKDITGAQYTAAAGEASCEGTLKWETVAAELDRCCEAVLSVISSMSDAVCETSVVFAAAMPGAVLAKAGAAAVQRCCVPVFDMRAMPLVCDGVIRCGDGLRGACTVLQKAFSNK